jgi:hypothetical protein
MSAKSRSPKDSQEPNAKRTPRPDQSDRLASALRDNLKRRKAQARAREEPGPGRDER